MLSVQEDGRDSTESRRKKRLSILNKTILLVGRVK